MDRFLELVAEKWQVDLAHRRYTYRWYTRETFITDSACAGENVRGCASGHTARSYTAPLDHELVHLIAFAIGVPPSFYAEGAAVAFELPAWFDSPGLPGERPILELLTVAPLDAGDYVLAGAYTRHLIDRFGMSAYLEFYGSLERSADLATITAAHAAAFGEPLEASIAAFDVERRDCEHERFRFKLVECAAPRATWAEDILTLRRGISCAEDDVVGPFLGTTARAYASFEVAEAGLFELSAVSDERGNSVTLGSCGGCEAESPVTLITGSGPQRVALSAGPHYFRLESQAKESTQLSLQLRRVD
jgi:hypothetical protein